MGYHQAEIPKGELGEFSKIMEEVLEMRDAIDQNAKVLVLAEMVDVIGAMTLYTERHYPGLTFDDLVQMAKMTRVVLEEKSILENP